MSMVANQSENTAASLDEPILSVRGLEHAFSVGGRHIPVLRGIDLDIRRGEKVFLCGPSGAGKTTLLYTLAGLEKPTSGTISIMGKRLYTLSSRQRASMRNQSLGYIFQHFYLMPELTALENVMLPAFISSTDRSAAAEMMLERVGLKDRMNHLPAELSGGEQQRVAIARALVNNPAMVFADEPTGNLDSKTGLAVMELLLELVDDGNMTLVVVTHDHSLTPLGDRIIDMHDGLIVPADTGPEEGSKVRK